MNIICTIFKNCSKATFYAFTLLQKLDTRVKNLLTLNKDKKMEQINKIELRGNIGNLKIQDVGDKQVARFSLATNYIYKGRDGNPVIETTWHNVVAWSGRNIADFALLSKGAPVSVTGRLRAREYLDSEGNQKQILEIVANKMEIVEEYESAEEAH